MKDHDSVWSEGPVKPWRYYDGELPQDRRGPHGREGVTKQVFASGGGNAMQVKGKKLKSIWNFNKKLEGSSL